MKTTCRSSCSICAFGDPVHRRPPGTMMERRLSDPLPETRSVVIAGAQQANHIRTKLLLQAESDGSMNDLRQGYQRYKRFV